MTKARKFVLWSAVFLSALIAVCGPAQAETCRLLKMAKFDISSEPFGAVTVPVSLNGTVERFLVDTGGTYSTISPVLVKKLGLSPRLMDENFEFYLADGTMLDHYVNIKAFDVGAISESNVHLIVEPHVQRGGAGAFGGTLAPDFLSKFDLDFDFGHNTLNLFSPDHCDGRVVYWASHYAAIRVGVNGRDNHINVPVTLDGRDYAALLDTGAALTLLSERAAYRDFDLKAGGPGLEPITDAPKDALVRYRHRFKTLTIDSITVNNPIIGILRDAAEQSFWRHHSAIYARDPVFGLSFRTHRIILGMDVLRKLHLYIAYKEKKLYVTAASAQTADAAPPTHP